MGKKIRNIFEKPFMMNGETQDPAELDFRIYGLHKKETFDANGDLVLLQYYKGYDAVNKTFEDIAVEERRVYSRDVNTGLPLTRITDIDWFDEDGNVQTSKLQITKYYSSKKGFEANKRARKNVVEVASMYLFGELIANDAPTADANATNFEELTDSATTKYIRSNTQPLLDIITNITDNTKPEYRAYITVAMRDALLAILNVNY